MIHQEWTRPWGWDLTFPGSSRFKTVTNDLSHRRTSSRTQEMQLRPDLRENCSIVRHWLGIKLCCIRLVLYMVGLGLPTPSPFLYMETDQKILILVPWNFECLRFQAETLNSILPLILSFRW